MSPSPTTISRLGIVIGLGLLAALPSQSSLSKTRSSSPAIEKTITLEFKADFLEAGLQESNKKIGNEIQLTHIKWKTPTEGTALASIWNVNSLIDFQTDPENQNIKRIQYNPKSEKAANMWKIWRHRHAYLYYPGKGYYWNSIEDHRPKMKDDTGNFYDQYLKELWSYWTLHSLPLHEGSDNQKPSEIKSENKDTSTLIKDVEIRYDEFGLKDPISIPFNINLWHMPVEISFEVNSSSTSHLSGDYTWTYDRSEWRRRHGYKKNIFGRYVLNSNWPEPRKLTKTEGKQLDELLDRAVAYWVEVSVQMVLIDLSVKVNNAVSSIASQ